MTTYTYPTTGSAFAPAGLTWTQRHNTRVSTSSLNGATQTSSLPGSRWAVSLDYPIQTYAERAQIEALLTRLSGMEHRLALWDVSRPQRRGTCNLTGVTVSAVAAQFAAGLVLAGCGASTTLLAGDWLRVTTSNGAQLLQIAADATASAGGAMTVETRPLLRGSVASGAAVTLDKPTALFVLATPELSIPRGGTNKCPPFSVELMEVFS
ncbi:hypothetical protein Lcho_2234 [Leptothrix cholodnii SP-6]|uniref:Uncharacterized protein n=1 Tax=Leptothrix cholodnii (strain ATCC 51168 / LMG 8142 / SP-6) TaxID=395495 RepID=B1Y3H2_LEPCP|nr:hypothetical protein [Leptothrix cholodnii]ACB34500.1 hypothetical protein Lcho_2234 [Leptothrix cholodnii SP-6]